MMIFIQSHQRGTQHAIPRQVEWPLGLFRDKALNLFFSLSPRPLTQVDHRQDLRAALADYLYWVPIH